MTSQLTKLAASELRFATHGAALFPGVAKPWIAELTALFASQDQAGQRLSSLGRLAPIFCAQGEIGSLVAKCLGAGTRPVRAIAFDKSDAVNWALGWHQDRTICVTAKADMVGFGSWTIKRGMHHVEPPFELLERMVTMRIHIDPVDTGNAPLKVALGSHRVGRVSESALPTALARFSPYECLAAAGDVWLYATPILHASDRADAGRQRRVLQIDYAAEDLPPPLEWALALSD